MNAETLLKDYWVTEVLRVLVEGYSESFVFKGGTSLTKAFHCVDRFSEDIDILITEKPDDMSFDRLMKTMASAVTHSTGLEGERVGGTTNVWRSVKFTFPTRHGAVLRPEVILEMGVRGSDAPQHVVRDIRPLLADATQEGFDPSEYPDLRAFPIHVLHPARTLWEKVVLLHHDVTSNAWKRHQDPSRFARHYGDIGALLGMDEVKVMLNDQALRSRLDQEVREISRRWFGGDPAPVPEGGYSQSDAFVLSGEFGEFLTQSFEEAVEVLWSSIGRPSLHGVLAAIKDNAAILDPCV
ncbi:MAG: nucleotidyl transferase AbiEii/AbiGii toxin family protein [Acidimicrobiia bacterium]|nr:nucleotidyl transferase AbiEii/AbiGii toxin family protein [Acidimicrobiia bacterium]